jgi:hypothetical protein
VVLQTWSVMKRSPFLVGMSPWQLSAPAAAASLVDSADEIPIPKFAPFSALGLRDRDDEVSILHPRLPCLSSFTSPPMVCPQPAPQAGSHGR